MVYRMCHKVHLLPWQFLFLFSSNPNLEEKGIEKLACVTVHLTAQCHPKELLRKFQVQEKKNEDSLTMVNILFYQCI